MAEMGNEPRAQPPAMESLIVHDVEEIDLSYWELITLADARSDSDLDDVISWESEYDINSPRKLSDNENQDCDHHNPPDLDEKLDGDGRDSVGEIVPAVAIHKSIYDDEDEEVDDYDEDYGLDDELVPWQVSGKLGRQRMRKIGKRVFARMINSKRYPHSYVKPGCVYGKHGLGLKHRC
ncbi:uncharacterized protein LOC120001615 [Tripterygium wilfordii]|uniref:uncharacterized protein LOC120001615 n=1 Tax=Tripterygium wilfordii TaxID=458696 RepID=UPI0018F852BD|nr:uncharacterized protein LOC120001615 [Tripterygium wilfordii]